MTARTYVEPITGPGVRSGRLPPEPMRFDSGELPQWSCGPWRVESPEMPSRVLGLDIRMDTRARGGLAVVMCRQSSMPVRRS